MKRLKTIWLYTRFITAEIWLFTIYMIARTLKTPLFNLEIDPYGSWKCFDEQIERDTAITVALVLGTTGFIFLSWWWFLIIAGFAALNLIVLIVWMFRRARKNGTDTNTEIAVLKSTFKNKFKK